MRWLFGGRASWSIAMAVVCFAPRAMAADCMANDGSELTSCVAQLEAGDTLTLAAGTFEIDSVSFSGLAGTEQQPILVTGTRGSNGELLSHIIGQSSGSNVIVVNASSYLTFADLEISFVGGSSGNSVDLFKFQSGASHHITIDGCELHDCGNVAISSQTDELSDVVLRNSWIHDIGGSCIYWGYYEDDNPQKKVHHCTIERNLLQRCPASASSTTHYGIQLKSGNHDNIIQDNVLVDVSGTTRAGIIVYHSAPKPVGSPLAGSNIIRGNLMIRSRNEGINAAAGAIIDNNIVIDSAGPAINLQPRSFGGVTYYGSLEVMNNTVYQPSGGEGLRWTMNPWDQDDPSRPSVFTNNLALVGAGNAGLRPPNNVITVGNNATDGVDNGATDTVAIGDPLAAVVSVAFGDDNYLWPVEAGPLVDAGTEPAAMQDFNGTSRETPDIGAYEWTTSDNPGWTLDEDGFKQGGSQGGAGIGGAGGMTTGAGGDGGASSGSGAGGSDAAGGGASGGDSGCSCTVVRSDGDDLPAALMLLLLLACRRRRP